MVRKPLGLDKPNIFPTAGAYVSPEVEAFVPVSYTHLYGFSNLWVIEQVGRNILRIGIYFCQETWVTDIYDKMDISVRTLDIALVVLCAIVVFCFIYGAKH